MKIFYNIGIYGMAAGMKLAALFNDKAKKWVVGRRGVFNGLRDALNDEKQPVVWVHAASLGEFEQGRPVMEAIRSRMPEHKILLTFFSPSGYEIRKNYNGADWVFYLPADTPNNARRFVEIVKPEITIFIKYEFWLNYLSEAKRHRSRLFLISALFLPDFVFFKPYGGHFREALGWFERIYVQNDRSRELLAGIGVHNTDVAGDTRFDRVFSIASNAVQLPVVERFAADARVLIAGSTWEVDEEMLLEAVKSRPDIKFIIAPHEIHADRIEAFMERSGRKCVRYTQVSDNDDVGSAEVLFIDTIGILSSVYAYGSRAYIGGGFGAGIHNILEAATFGLKIAFGPNYRKFQEAHDLIELGGACSVSSSAEFLQWLDTVADGGICRRYVADRTGATEMIMTAIIKRSCKKHFF